MSVKYIHINLNYVAEILVLVKKIARDHSIEICETKTHVTAKHTVHINMKYSNKISLFKKIMYKIVCYRALSIYCHNKCVKNTFNVNIIHRKGGDTDESFRTLSGEC